jgi:hypothetical protein
MAFVKSKGTTLKQYIASVYTAVAQVIDLDWSGMKAGFVPTDTLDNASSGVPKMNTGDADFGSVKGNLFFDPALSGHKAMLALLVTPAAQLWQMIFADTGATTWGFSGVGFGFDGPKIAIKDGLKAAFSIEVSGTPSGLV